MLMCMTDSATPGVGSSAVRQAEQLAPRVPLDLQDRVGEQLQLSPVRASTPRTESTRNGHVVIDDVDDRLRGGWHRPGRAGSYTRTLALPAVRWRMNSRSESPAPAAPRVVRARGRSAERRLIQGAQKYARQLRRLRGEPLPGHVVELIDEVDLEHFDAGSHCLAPSDSLAADFGSRSAELSYAQAASMWSARGCSRARPALPTCPLHVSHSWSCGPGSTSSV